MTIRFASLLSTVIVLAAIAGGCGSGSSGESSGTQESTVATETNSEAAAGSPEKKAFIAKAGAACTKARESGFEQVQGKQGGSPGAAIRAALLAALKAEIAAIRSLPAPAEDRAEVGEIIDQMEAALRKGEAMKGAAPEEIEALFANSDKKLEAYGLAACSKSA